MSLKAIPTKRFIALSALSLAISAANIQIVNALPTNGNVVGGNVNATIISDGITTTIDQKSEVVTIEWDSFNINVDQTVDFQQPGTSSIAINKIGGGSASEIFGKITSNGQVFLSNPNGFLFGAGSSINTGSFLATTSNMALSSNDDGSHELTLDTPTDAGIIFNAGSNITTNTDKNGAISSNRNETFIAIFSPNIENLGNLTANNSSIILSNKNIGTIKLYGLNDIGIDISGLEASEMNINNSLIQTGNLSTGTDSYIALSNTELTTLIQSAINSPTELTANMFKNHLQDYDINVYGTDLTLKSANPLSTQLNSERTLTFTATNTLNILSTIQGRNLNLKLNAKDITIGGYNSRVSLGGSSGLKSIDIITSGAGTLNLYSGMKAIDNININANINYYGNEDANEIIFSTENDTGSITFHKDKIFTASDNGIDDAIFFESNTLNLSAIEGFNTIEFDSADIWLSDHISANTIKTNGGGNLYLMKDITLFASDVDFKGINIASYVENIAEQGHSLTLDAKSNNAKFTLYDIQDNDLISDPANTNLTILKGLVFKSVSDDSRLSLSGDFSTEEFILGSENSGNFELKLLGDLTIKSLKTFDTQYATTTGIFNFDVQGYFDNQNANTAKLGKISDSTTLNSVSITDFNDISLFGDISASSGDIALSANKIYINNDPEVLNIGNNSDGKITLSGDIQTSNTSGLAINTFNGHIEIDGISESNKLNSFAINKTLKLEGSVKINSDIYVTNDITLKNLGDIEFSKDITLSANNFDSTGSHLNNDIVIMNDEVIKNAFDLTIETNETANLGQITAKNINVIGKSVDGKSESNLNDAITASDKLTFLNTNIELQSNVALTGNINFLDETTTVEGSDPLIAINKPTINGNYDLTLNATNTDIHVYDFGNTTALRSLSIEGYGNIVFDDNPIIDNLGNGSGGLSLLGDLNFNVGENADFDTSDYDGYLDFSGATINGIGTLTFNTGTGDLTLGTIGNNSVISELTINSTGKLNLYGDITLETPTYDFSKLSAVQIYKDMTFGSVDTGSKTEVKFGNATLDGTYSLTVFADTLTLGTIGSNIALQDLTIHSGADLLFDHDITMVGTADINAASLMLNNTITTTGLNINLVTTGDLTMSESAVLNAVPEVFTEDSGNINLSSTSGNISIASVNAAADVSIDAMGGSIFNNIDDYISNSSTSTNVSSENLNLNALNQIGTDVKSPIVIDIQNGGGITAEANDGIYIANRNSASVSSRSLVIDSSAGGEAAAIDAYSQFKLSALNQVNTPTVTTTFGLISNLAWQTDEEESIRKIKTPNSAPPIYYSRRGWRLGY